MLRNIVSAARKAATAGPIAAGVHTGPATAVPSNAFVEWMTV